MSAKNTNKVSQKVAGSTAAKLKVAQSAAKRAKEEADIAVAAADKLKAVAGQGAGFMTFVREQGVVGLAVGLAIGAAAGDTVKKLVEGFINPVVQLLVGSREGLESAIWHVGLWGRSADFKWGAFLSSAITLLATAFVIYFIIKGLKLDKLDKKKS